MLVARSTQEAHLYMDLHACECGAEYFERWHRLEQRGDRMVAVYEGACAWCERPQAFVFRMLEETSPALPSFGGSGHSTILDPGEFMWISDRVAADVVLRMLNTPQPEPGQFYAQSAYALAAFEEAAKFLPKEAERVPDHCFTSKRGRAVLEKDPSAFERQWLMDNLERKRRILSRIEHPHAAWRGVR